MLNPYPSEKISACPLCEQRNRQRKLPLVILINPETTFVLDYTCRYCPQCDLLVGHKHVIEELLAIAFRKINPEVIGNKYLIVGTAEKSAWLESMIEQRTAGFMLEHTQDFAVYYQELRVTQAGWFHKSVEPPIMEPPPSRHWVKPAFNNLRSNR